MTSDSHYIDALDSKYHDILKDMAGQLKFTANNHLFTPEEKESFCLEHNIPLEALYNTGVIANKCNVNPKPSDHRALLPIFPCPKGYDESSYLRKLAFDGLREKIVKNNIHNPQKYLTKMIYELDVICNAGFAGYFLILWDWFKWCRENNILMGTGRGSAAGSCVAYSLNITKVDPIKNKFFFERFLNPSRLEFPDVDSDVPRDKRAKAIRYLLQKYGEQNVSQIITFGKYKLKNTIKAIMSALDCPFAEANAVTRDIPDSVDGNTVTFDFIEDITLNPDQEKYDSISDSVKKGLAKNYETLMELFNKYPVVYEGVKNLNGCISGTGRNARLTQSLMKC